MEKYGWIATHTDEMPKGAKKILFAELANRLFLTKQIHYYLQA